MGRRTLTHREVSARRPWSAPPGRRAASVRGRVTGYTDHRPACGESVLRRDCPPPRRPHQDRGARGHRVQEVPPRPARGARRRRDRRPRGRGRAVGVPPNHCPADGSRKPAALHGPPSQGVPSRDRRRPARPDHRVPQLRGTEPVTPRRHGVDSTHLRERALHRSGHRKSAPRSRLAARRGGRSPPCRRRVPGGEDR